MNFNIQNTNNFFQPWSKINELHLQVTTACNLHCIYCYDADQYKTHGMRLMSEAMAIQTIDKVFSQTKVSEINIIFHGGEPLLQPIEFFDHICSYAKTKNSKLSLSFGMQSNLTLLTQEKADVLGKHQVSLGTSLDGPPEIHNSYRGKYNSVIRGIKIAKQKNIFSGVITVIHRHNFSQMPFVLGHFLELGIDKAYCNIGSCVGSKAENLSRLTAEEIFIAMIDIFNFMEYHDFNFIEKRILGKVERFIFKRFSRYPNFLSCDTPFCHAGISMIAVDVDGKVFPCGCAGTDGNFKSYQIASIDDPSSFDKTRLLKFHSKSEKYQTKCEACPAKYVCEHGCPAFDLQDAITAESTCQANIKFYHFLNENLPIVRKYEAYLKSMRVS